MLTSDEMRENEMARRNMGNAAVVPVSIRLLIKVWEHHDRFVPDGVRSHLWGQQLSDDPEWRWDGSKDQDGQDVHLDLFHNWSILDQQTFLEAAVGHIFTILSRCPRTVIQIRDTEVSVKHRELNEVRRYANGLMLENLLGAILKMIEVEWLPTHKSKEGDYHYSQSEMKRADHDYELRVLKQSKSLQELRLKDLQPTLLPSGDPFSDSPYFGRPNVESDMIKQKLVAIREAIALKEKKIETLERQSCG